MCSIQTGAYHAITVRVVCYFMIIPHWNPRELLVTFYEVQICAVGGQTLTVIVQGENLPIRQRDTPEAIPPAVVAVLVFVNIVS
jgi:hypothetical protein